MDPLGKLIALSRLPSWIKGVDSGKTVREEEGREAEGERKVGQGHRKGDGKGLIILSR